MSELNYTCDKCKETFTSSNYIVGFRGASGNFDLCFNCYQKLYELFDEAKLKVVSDFVGNKE